MGTLGRAAIGLPLTIAVVTSACTAVAPAPVPPDHGTPVRQRIEVTPHKAGSTFLQASGFRMGNFGSNDPSIEATCTASNDRGSWTIAAPGRFEIIPSTAPLRITCGREGYRESTIELKCRSPTSWNAGIAAQAFTMIPLGVVIGIPLMAVALADAPDARDCVYTMDNSLHVWLDPLR